MPQNAAAFAHYAVLTAMLAPAFFLTATASLLMSANNRLSRIIDRLRSILKELEDTSDPEYRGILEQRIAMQRRRNVLILRGSQLLYGAISCFVGTSLSVAVDAFVGYRFGMLPTLLAVFGVLALFAASLCLARESTLAITAINEEMDHRYAIARMRKREQHADAQAEGETE
ncbi:DUF2721 domain-containing protein [Luteimonas sp. SX5]|uniref:DUF2721 domain-containing protein n=1 Tax=Luteimonas galliterrae TaxID=2940486 RepID=A0ABT0MFI5_9GAMM|nr:DUF2721 domain-containing protein [Luteimonas galliterrae]MCL1633616.1 DUF2721 domain-containing protein [Luteimonas galliterrae]